MKSILRVNVIATAIVFSGSGMAAEFADRAVVVSVAPNMVASAPTCTTEPVPAPAQPTPEHSVLGMAAGAAVGGLLGHQVGKGRGQTVTTIGGAVAGAVIGDKMANSGAQPQAAAATQQRCTQNPPQQQGWLTTYTYAGRTFTEVTPWTAQPGQAFGISVHLNASGSTLAPVANGGAR
jgi:uncharacterized protein YcfJ